MVTITAIPAPPRTPTPPSEEDDQVQANALGLRQETHDAYSPGKINYGRDDMLSPMSNNFVGSRQSPSYVTSPSFPPSLNSPRTFGTAATPVDQGFNSRRKSVMSDLDGTQVNGTENKSGPFGFQTVEYTVGRPPGGKSTVGQRRGHKYKHSSVSHQFFLEPPPRPPLQLPASLPTPTMKECWRSMSREQTSRSIWCFCHLFVAGYVQWSAHGLLMLEVLSHLLMFDTLGAFVCAGVDVFGNFEVWKRSSIRHPFGLQRAEVLASFAMSVFLIFMGLDLISHNLTHALESSGNHEPHNVHPHAERLSSGSVDVAAVAAISTTLVSALILKNHARIGKALRIAYIASLPSVLSNPSHLLTLSCSGAVLLLPLLPPSTGIYLDRALAASFAIAMLGLGITLGSTLSRILLMSYAGRHSTGRDVDIVIADIRSDPIVRAIDEAKFWQVHYGLCMANLKLRVNGSVEELARLRDRVSSLVKNRLGGGYGSGSAGQRWEVSTQLILEREPWMSGTSAVQGSFGR